MPNNTPAIKNGNRVATGQPIKVLHITTVPLSLRFLEGQIGYMQSHGIEVEVLSSPGKLLNDFGNEQAVEIHATKMPRKITPFRDLIAVWQIYRVIRRTRPTIVHAHTPKGGLLGMIASWLARTRARVYHMRGLPFVTTTGMKRRLLILTERISCTLSHRVICNSFSLQTIALEHQLCSLDKITVLANGSGNGVDAQGLFNPDNYPNARQQKRAEFNIPTDAIVIGFVGRLVRDKGVIELFHAWQQLKQEFQNIYLMLVGPTNEEDVIPSDVLATLQADIRVKLAGMVNDKRDIPPYFAMFDMLVLPTYREGFPNVLLEASAMGLSVVSTQVSGCVDAVINGQTGTLVPAKDSQELTHAIRQYIENPTLLQEHGTAAQVYIRENFRPQDIWEALLKEYRMLLNISDVGLE